MTLFNNFRHIQQIVIILDSIAFLFLLYAITDINPNLVDIQNPLGLASIFPPLYWIGLVILLISSIILFHFGKNVRKGIFLCTLILLGLYFSGLTIFVEVNPKNSGQYYPSSEVNNIILAGGLGQGDHLPASYYLLPGIHLISASLILVTSINLISLLKFFSLLWYLVFIFLTFSIAKRFGLSSSLSFLFTFFMLCSYWLSQTDYTPQGLGYLLFLMIVLFAFSTSSNKSNEVATTIVFIGLLLTHSLTALVALLSLGVLSIFRRDRLKFTLFYSVILFTWYFFNAYQLLISAIQSILIDPFRTLFFISNPGVYVTSAPLTRLIYRYSQLSFVGIYAILVFLAIVSLMLIKKNRLKTKQFISCISLLIGIGLANFIVSVPPTGDLLSRTVAFAIIPTGLIPLIFFGNWRKILTVLMVVFLILHITTFYGPELAYSLVPTSELSGANYVASKAISEKTFFTYGGDEPKFIWFYNPNLINSYWISLPDEMNLTLMNKADYMIFSDYAHRGMIWSYNEDPFLDWLSTPSGIKANLVYQNEHFWVYLNNHVF